MDFASGGFVSGNIIVTSMLIAALVAALIKMASLLQPSSASLLGVWDTGLGCCCCSVFY